MFLSLGLLLSGIGNLPKGDATALLQGSCSSESVVAIGSKLADLNNNTIPFRCDSATVTFFIEQDRVLIHFIKKDGAFGLVGFAGSVGNGEIAVDRLYLNDGNTIGVPSGFCKIRSEKSDIKSITCATRTEQGEVAVGAMISFVAG